MENIHPDILALIVRHLQGGTSQPEEKQLAAWVMENPQNKAGFEEVKAMWAQTEKEPAFIQPDTDAAWEKVKARTVSKGNAPQKGKVVQMPGIFWKVAASLFLVLGIGYTIKNVWTNEEAAWTTVASLSEKKMVTLPDGSTVWLNKNSSLSYSDFEGDKRELKLEGEAFFEVKRKPEQPFQIQGRESLTEVLGTSFNLKTTGKGHDQVEVVTGLVAFSSNHNPVNRLELRPGQKGEMMADGKATETVIRNQNFRSWQTNHLSFDNTTLPEVVASLEEYFGIEVEIENPALTNCRFTGSFDKPDVQSVIQILSLSVNLKAEQKDSTYYLKGTGCP